MERSILSFSVLENVEILPSEAPYVKGMVCAGSGILNSKVVGTLLKWLREQQPLRPGLGGYCASRSCPSVRTGSLKDCAWSILWVSGFLWGELGAQSHGDTAGSAALHKSPVEAPAPMGVWGG